MYLIVAAFQAGCCCTSKPVKERKPAGCVAGGRRGISAFYFLNPQSINYRSSSKFEQSMVEKKEYMSQVKRHISSSPPAHHQGEEILEEH